jgi:serine/threonine-protein kinase
VFSETIEKDLVISVEPQSGERLAKDSTVKLIVSKGPERFAVPSVSGQSVADATVAITAVNLEVSGTTSKFSSVVTKGMVIGTDPDTGTKLLKGSAVTLVISKGPQPIKVPSVKGLGAQAAIDKLQSAGFTTVTQVREFSSSVASGKIIKVSPRSGSKQLPEATITLTISDGPPPVIVPNVVGKTKKQAFSALEGVGLVPVIDTSNKCSKRIVNSAVLEQSAKAGSKLPEGSTVKLGIFYYCKK